MSNSNDIMLDPIIHQPIRTKIVAYLASRKEVTFSELKEVACVTDGNLDSHMKKLIQSGYVVANKVRLTKRLTTVYSLTDAGVNAFKQYVDALHTMLGLSS